MKHNSTTASWNVLLYLIIAVIAFVMIVAVTAKAQEPTGFSSPQQAADALVKAAATFDKPTLRSILGPESETLIASSDPVMDQKRASNFAKAASEKMQIEKKKDTAMILVGNSQWPMPIPLVRRDGKWYFDVSQGREEILLRRIGSNELDAIAVCRGFVEAQKEYALEPHDGSGIPQYARRIVSTTGEKDGLVWKNEDGTIGGPISENIARAIEEGYAVVRQSSFHGYYFKMLKGQGPAAPHGQLDFIINGVMIGGFALVATPAQYGITGIKTFIVSHDGIVYEKDLGKDSLAQFDAMTLYDPDKSWTATFDRWPTEALRASTD